MKRGIKADVRDRTKHIGRQVPGAKRYGRRRCCPCCRHKPLANTTFPAYSFIDLALELSDICEGKGGLHTHEHDANKKERMSVLRRVSPAPEKDEA